MARRLYTLVVYLLLPWALAHLLWRSRRQPQYLRHWRQRFGRYGVDAPGPIIWIHAVPVGETRAAQPRVAALAQRHPRHRILFPHMTPTARATPPASPGAPPSEAPGGASPSWPGAGGAGAFPSPPWRGPSSAGARARPVRARGARASRAPAAARASPRPRSCAPHPACGGRARGPGCSGGPGPASYQGGGRGGGVAVVAVSPAVRLAVGGDPPRAPALRGGRGPGGGDDPGRGRTGRGPGPGGAGPRLRRAGHAALDGGGRRRGRRNGAHRRRARADDVPLRDVGRRGARGGAGACAHARRPARAGGGRAGRQPRNPVHAMSS